MASTCYLGVITAVDVVALPPISRFNAPKHGCLYLTKQRIFRYYGFGFTKETTERFSFTHLNEPAKRLLTHTTRIGYIGDFDIIDDHRSGKIVVQLNGRLNKTGVISPRFNVQVTQIESWVNLLLPARSFGKLILVSVPREALSMNGVDDMCFRRPHPVFLTMKKHVAKMLEERSLAMCTR